MADVKWIKMDTGLPNSRKVKQIRKLPNGDTIALMWVFIMCLAGEVNENGMIYFTPEIPHTDEMLADEFGMDINTVRLGLKTFERFGMLEIINDIICLPSWEKWQSTDRLSEIREYNRLAKQKSRAKQKLLSESVNDMSMTSQRCQGTEVDIEEDIDIEIEEEVINASAEAEPPSKVNYQQIVDLYNSICTSLPSVKSLSDNRKKAIKARLNSYTVEDFKTVFENAEASSFLKGKNDRNWSATFDWLIKDGNMAKVLEGNYADKGRKEIVPKWAQTIRTEGYGSLIKKSVARNNSELQARAEALKNELAK